MVKALASTFVALLGRLATGADYIGDDWTDERAEKAAAYTARENEGAVVRGACPLDAYTATLLDTQRREALIATLRRDDAAVAARDARVRERRIAC